MAVLTRVLDWGEDRWWSAIGLVPVHAGKAVSEQFEQSPGCQGKKTPASEPIRPTIGVI